MTPDRCSIEVDFGGVTFKAKGDSAAVLTAYWRFMEQLDGADSAEEDATQENACQPLPHFRTKPVGTC